MAHTVLLLLLCLAVAVPVDVPPWLELCSAASFCTPRGQLILTTTSTPTLFSPPTQHRTASLCLTWRRSF